MDFLAGFLFIQLLLYDLMFLLHFYFILLICVFNIFLFIFNNNFFLKDRELKFVLIFLLKEINEFSSRMFIYSITFIRFDVLTAFFFLLLIGVFNLFLFFLIIIFFFKFHRVISNYKKANKI